MSLFKMELSKKENHDLLSIGFGDPATNQEIVKFVKLNAPDGGGKLLLINGPASLPVAGVLVHKYAHLYGAIAMFDPKLQGYVVAISHDPAVGIGDLVKE